MNDEPLMNLDDALILTRYAAVVAHITGTADDGLEAEMDGIVITFYADEEAGEHSQVYIVPLDSWDELQSTVVRAILSYETGGESDADDEDDEELGPATTGKDS